MDSVTVSPSVLSFWVLDKITKGFSNDMKVGAGSYGDVYKGKYKNGEMIAVKVLRYIPGLDDEQFQKEYRNLSSLQHKNIVRLVGYCHETWGEFIPYEGKEIFAETIKRALCFEYMQNGSLDSLIADESSGHDWSTRYAIIKGICQGLKYLHEELVPPMWHLDLKPGNILLDENMVPKIADFGLARLFGGEQTHMTNSSIGTPGYVPPEYVDAAVITTKFDIFSLGVIMIKIMTGPTGYFRSAEMSPQQFIELVHGNWKNKLQTTTSVDALEPYFEQVKRCIEIALSCVDTDRHKRPSMGVIIDKLNETETAVQLLDASMSDTTGSSTYKTGSKPRHMSLQHLKDITNNFSDELIIGRGGFGVVYKGVLQHGETVAVKKLFQSISQEQFQNEVDLLMRLEHPNIVRLVGYCYETQHVHTPHEGKLGFIWKTEILLCLEFLPNGSLDKYISDASSGLDWHTRCKIIEGISYGLQYLHEEPNGPVIHLDLKPANILLDENMLPKITDLSLSRLLDHNQPMDTVTTKLGTLAYMAPEFLREGIISSKSDIFSLGIIIMEVIIGHRDYPYDIRTSSEEFIEQELCQWRNRVREEPVYTSLKTDCKHIERCLQIGLICVNPDRRKRPTMKKVIGMLQGLESMDWYISNELTPAAPYDNVTPTTMESGSMQLAIKNHKRVMLEITGGDYNRRRPGLDLVAVVDVSGSMNGEKMEGLKTALQFVVQKLTPIDRLCIVTFSNRATRLCTLIPMSKASQADLQQLIDDLMVTAHDGTNTNIKAGLLGGLKILYDRETRNARVASIMLISGAERMSGDAAEVDIRGNVAVHTFGFGDGSDPVVLSAVAANSNGGTFSNVQDIGGGGLTMAFSQCLAGLLTVTVQDLKVTLAPVEDESAIVKVTFGNYMQTKHRNGSVTVSFGNVYSREVRCVIVDLSMPPTIKSAEILKVTHSISSSSYSGRLQFAVHPDQATLDVWRTGISMEVLEKETPKELETEETRLHVVKMIKDARIMADCEKLKDAQDKLVEAQNMLVEQSDLLRPTELDVLLEQSNQLLRIELQELLEFFKTPETYKQYGRAYALSMESSHDRQRFAARGAAMMVTRPFATPRMDMYQEQASKFLGDQTRAGQTGRPGTARHSLAVNGPGTSWPAQARLVNGPCRAGPRADPSGPGTAWELYGLARRHARPAGLLHNGPFGLILGPILACWAIFFIIYIYKYKK